MWPIRSNKVFIVYSYSGIESIERALGVLWGNWTLIDYILDNQGFSQWLDSTVCIRLSNKARSLDFRSLFAGTEVMTWQVHYEKLFGQTKQSFLGIQINSHVSDAAVRKAWWLVCDSRKNVCQIVVKLSHLESSKLSLFGCFEGTIEPHETCWTKEMRYFVASQHNN